MSLPTIDHRYAPPRRWTCIGRPDDPHKTLVTEHGALLYGFERDPGRIETYRFAQVIAFRPLGDRRLVSVEQRTESARVPITVTTLDYGSVRLELRTAGHVDEALGRCDLVRWRIEADAGLDEPALTGIWLQIQALDQRFVPASRGPGHRIYRMVPERVPAAEGLPAMFEERPAVDDAPEGVTLALVSDRPLEVASAFDYGPASALATTPELVAPGDAIEGAFLVPLEVPAGALVWSLAECDRRLEAERRYWETLPALDVPIDVPDDAVQAMLVASARNILQAREVEDGLPVFQVGPTIYRGLWIVDGYFFLEAARYLGLGDDADHGLDVLLRRAQPSGAIEEMPFHHKETGIAIATLVRQTELVGDRARLERLWPTIRRAGEYVVQLMDAADALPQSAPERGIMPRSFPDGGIGGMRPEYTTALWSLIGFAAAARGARWLGLDDDAARFEAQYDRLLAATERGRARDERSTAGGLRYWPMTMPGAGDHVWVPGFAGEPPVHRRVNPGSANWALAQAIWPGEVYRSDHPVVHDLLALCDATDEREGVPEGTGWLPFRASWNYATAFYAQVWLYAGRPDKAVDYLYAMANHAGPTRTWREEQSFSDSGDALVFGDMPHNWASVEFVRLVRSLLVFERLDGLDLLAGVPDSWWRQRRAFGVERLPSRFGDVTVRVAPSGEAFNVSVEIARRADQPVAPNVRLRVPEDVGSVRHDGRTLAPGWRRLDPGGGTRSSAS
ncbi:MAG: hypothetical protein EA416_04320 [Trueperaceae bacterium]|nr:MAG: hypothetical protein EA416_04320 [Trueperaceae bacterium]